MKSVLFVFILLCIFKFSFAQEKIIPSDIEEVTVFQNGAQISRTAKTYIKAGRSVILFDNLPQNINDESILVSGIGDFTILSVVNQLVNENVNRVDEDEIARLNSEIISLTDSINLEKSKLEIYQGQINLLSKLDSKFDAGKEFTLDDFVTAIEFQNKKLTNLKLNQLQSNNKIRLAQEEIARIRKEITEQSQSKYLAKKQIIVNVFSKQATSAGFKITYYINNAGWESLYDIRIQDINHPLELVHKANVHQNTGEDWNNVLLTLSNGNPLESGIRPYLQSWYLDYTEPEEKLKFSELKESKLINGVVTDRSTGEVIPGASVYIQGTSIGSISDLNGKFSIQAPSGSKAIVISFVGYKTKVVSVTKSKFNIKLVNSDQNIEEVVVTGLGTINEKKSLGYSADIPVAKNTHQTTIDFKIDIPYTIASDGKKYAVKVRTLSYPTEYQYYCVPKLDKNAFLIAKITDWEESDITTGSANLYFEGTYLGKSQLNLNAVKDTIFLSLGRDKNIKVERLKLEMESSKNALGNKITDETGWSISVKNLKKEPVNIMIEDQLPLSDSEEIIVSPLELTNGILDANSGKIKWSLRIPPKKDENITFRFSIKYPKDYKISMKK